MTWLKIFFCSFFLFFFSKVAGLSPNNGSSSLAEELVMKGDSLMADGKFEQALTQFRQAAPFFEAQGNWEEVVFNKLDVAVCLLRLGRFTEMEKELLKTEEDANKQLPKNDKVFRYLYHMTAIAYSRLGDYPQAIDYEHRVLKNYQANAGKEANSERLVSVYNNLGFNYDLFGDFHKAAEYFEMALNLQKEIDPENGHGLELYYNNLIPVFKDMGEYEQALGYGKILLELYNENPSKISAEKFISCYNNLASTYSMMGDNDSALFYLEEALKLKQITDNLYEKTSHNLGFVYKEKKEWSKAITYLNQAISLNQEISGLYHPDIANAYRQLGVIYSENQAYEKALNAFQQAMYALAPGFTSDDYSLNPSMDSVLAGGMFLQTLRDKAHTLALADSNLSMHKAAHQTRMLAVAQMDRLRISFASDSKQLLAKKYLPMFEEGILDALRLFERTKDVQYKEDAFFLAEKSKSMILLEAVQESKARLQSTIPDSIADKELQINLALGSYLKQIFLEKQKDDSANTENLRRWKQKVFDLKRDREQLITYLEEAYPNYHQLKYEMDIASPSEIQAYLKAHDSELVTYFTGESHLYIFHISPDEIAIESKEISQDLFGELMTFIAHLQDYNLALEGGLDFLQAYEKEALKWFEVLLKKVKPQDKNLIIVPDGLLGYLPFEALITHDTENPTSYGDLNFLVKRTPIHYAYSGTLLLSGDEIPSGKRQFVGFAPSYSYPKSLGNAVATRGEFIPLTYNQPEVKTIAKIWNGKAFLGADATESQFKMNAPGSHILHMAMHGIINDEDPLYSGLAFSNISQTPELENVPGQNEFVGEDGFLHAFELYALRLDAELVVLSACNTGNGKLRRGEGIMSLSRAFRYAGCPNQVMSLWQAEDKASFKIMEEFYTELSAKEGKASALRRAKLAYLENFDQGHPFFWANYVLVGDDLPIDAANNTRFPTWGWLLLGVILLGGILFFTQRKNHFTER